MAGDELTDEDRLLFGDTDAGIPAPFAAPVAIGAQHAPLLLLPPPTNASVLPNVDHLLVAQSAADAGGEVPLSAEERRNQRVRALINVRHAPVLPFKVQGGLRALLPHLLPSLLAARTFTALHTTDLDPAPPCPLSPEAAALSHQVPLEEKRRVSLKARMRGAAVRVCAGASEACFRARNVATCCRGPSPAGAASFAPP